jgi:CubicO group peptidase (beta-lactamase class C family)
VDLEAATETAPADNRCEAQAERVAAQLRNLGEKFEVPAMGLSIFCDGQPLITAGYGNATADTPFRWGSITKSVTGLAALKLVRRTDITQTSPIRPILGKGYYDNPWAETHPVRLGHLLALSAGLPDLTRADWDDNEPRALWQALARHQDGRTVLWPPGLQHRYSNVPPGLTAAVIERVSGQLFDTFLERHLFLPLGMREAGLSPVPGLPGGFKADGKTEIPYWHMTFQAFGALNASTREMTRLLTALLNNGALEGEQPLDAELVAAFFRPLGTLSTRAGLEVGYGAGVYGWVRGGHIFHGHGGDADGYRSRYGLLREQGRGYLLVINKDNPQMLNRMRRLLEDALIDDLPHPASPARDPATTAELDAFTGDYYPASVRFGRNDWQTGKLETVQVRRSGQTLLFERSEQSTRLFPAGQGRFFRQGDPAITIVFARDDGHSLHLQGELGDFVRISPGPCPDFLPFCD